MGEVTDALKGFFAKKSTVLIQLNARLQPAHRDDLEAALVERLGGSIPSLKVIGGGVGTDKEERITGCGIEIAVLSAELEASLLELASALNDLGVPRGSLLVTPPKRKIKVGMADGLAIAFPRIVHEHSTDARGLPHTDDLDRAIAELGEALGAEGRVWSWQILDDGAELAVYGADGERLREIVKATFPREGAYSGYRVAAIT